MALIDDLENDVKNITSFTWDIRTGTTVPTTESIALGGSGVELTATMLYADLADSTKLSMWSPRVSARVHKAFLSTSARIIRARDGQIRSFDGDRIMGVFVGGSKNSNAARAALQINWTFRNLVRPKLEEKFSDLKSFNLSHTTGIDLSEMLVVRAGIYNNNDLSWIGRAPNVAAKLSALRDAPYYTFITGEVYDMLSEDAKFASGTNMWEERTWTNGPVKRIFRSSYWWKP
jgi:adenylate cyclase